jgi:multicomponent Na+:H+ antiporter subunit A
LIGLSTPAALKAAVVFLIVHSLYKSVLFLVAGAVDHETGTRDILNLGGLRSRMPYSFSAAVLAGLSMAGLPPLFGFIGKELAYKAKLGVEGIGWVLPSVAVIANALTVVAAALLVLRPFFGRASRLPGAASSVHEAPPGMWVGPLLIGSASLLLGIVPGLLVGLVTPAVQVVAGEPFPVKLSLWYGVNAALFLSIVTVALGVLGAWKMDALRHVLQRFDRVASAGPQAAYHRLLNGLPTLAKWQTQFFEGGSLRTYLGAMFATIIALVGGTYIWMVGLSIPLEMPSVQMIDLAVLAVTAAAAVAVTVTHRRIVAVTALGVVGVGVALIFVLFSAPDLAMTQFLVEILIVVIVLLVIQHLPDMEIRVSTASRLRDGAIALGVGGLVTTLLLAVHRVPASLHLSEYFGETAVPGGFGRNVVNVILVDFRALDTLGEIAVIAIAALGAFVLIKMNASRGGTAPPLRPSVVLQTGTRLLMTVLLLASLFMLWRGHNEPGGGFIGGLVAAAALVLYTIAYRQSGTEQMLRVAPRVLVGSGLAIALASGVLGVINGQAYLTGLWTSVDTGSGPLKLGTPLLFDIGVFLTVVGVVLTMVLALERVSTASPDEEEEGPAPSGEQPAVPPPETKGDDASISSRTSRTAPATRITE